MADINMDNINIKIESSSENASGGITKLIETLTSLNGMLSNININANKFVKNMEKIKNINKVKGKVDNVTPKEDMKKKDIFSLFSNIKNPFNKYNEGSKEANKNTNRLNSVFETLAKTVGRLTISTGSFVSSLLKTRAIKIGAGLIRMKDQISSILKSLKQYTTALFGIRSAFYAVRNVSNEFLNSQNAAAQQLKVNVGYLKYALGGSLAPIIRYISDLVYKVLQAVQYLVYYFTRINIFAGLTAESYKGIGTAAGKATKEAQKQLQAFDELNNITLEMNSASGSGGADDLLPEYDLSQVNMEMAELFEDIENLGKNLAEKINSALEGIEWDKILEGAEQLSLKLANILNDFTKYLNFEDIGYTIGQGFNTILNFVDTFFQTYDWKQLGIKLGQGFNKLIETVQWDKLGRVLTDKTRALILTVSNLISTIKWDELGAKIGEMLTSAFDNIPWESLGKLLNDAMIGVLDFVINFGKNFDSGKIITAIVKVFSQIDFGELLNKIITVFTEGGFTSVALTSALMLKTFGKNGSLNFKLGLIITITSLSLYSEGISGIQNGEVNSESLTKAIGGLIGATAGVGILTKNVPLAVVLGMSLTVDLMQKVGHEKLPWYLKGIMETDAIEKATKKPTSIAWDVNFSINMLSFTVYGMEKIFGEDFKQKLDKRFKEMLLDILSGIADFISKFGVIGEKIADVIRLGISKQRENLTKTTEETISGSIEDAQNKNNQTAQESTSQMITKMQESMENRRKEFKDTFEKTVNDSIKETEKTTSKTANETGLNLINQTSNGYINGMFKSKIEMSQSLNETLTEISNNNNSTAENGGQNNANSYKNEFINSLDKSQNDVKNKMEALIKNSSNDNTIVSENGGKKNALSWTTGYTDNISGQENVFQRVYNSLFNKTTQQNLSVAQASGQTLGSKTISGIEAEELGKVASLSKTTSDVISHSFKTVSVSGANNIGSNIISGIESGMTGSKWSLSNTISKIGSSILSGFKNVLGIHSPSVIMERSIGKFIPLGLAKGIDNSAKAVYDSMDRIAENVANTEFKDMSTILELDTAIKSPNGKFSAEIDTNSRISLEDSMKQIAEYCYEAIKEGFDESEAPKVDVRIGDEKVYSGYSRFQSEASNQYGVTI